MNTNKTECIRIVTKCFDDMEGMQRVYTKGKVDYEVGLKGLEGSRMVKNICKGQT